MILYHYSNKDFKGYIKASFFGENNYSLNSKRLSEVKRSYFYLSQDNYEYYFNGSKFLYLAEVNEKNLYNLDSNKINFKSQDIYSELQKLGYKGLYNNSQVILFNAVKILNKVLLTK